MANIQQEIINFDLNPQGATAQIDTLIAKLNSLQAEFNQLEKEGKDVSKVQAEIAATTQRLNTAMTQETKTVQGLTAQTKSLNTAQKELNNTTKQSESVGKTLDATNARAAKSFARVASSAKSVAGGIAGTVAAFTGLGGVVALVATKAVDALTASFLEYITASDESIDSTSQVTSAAKELVPEIVKEKSALDALVNTATNENKSKAERKAAFDELQKQYPDYFGSLSLEKSSLDQIKKAQDAATDALIRNIVVKAQQEKINEVVAKRAQQQLELERELEEAQRAGAKTAADAQFAISQAGADAAARDRILAAQEEQSRTATANSEAAIRERQKQANAEAQAELDAIGRQYGKVAEALQGVFRGVTIAGEASTKAGTATSKAAIKQTEQYKILDGSLADLEKKLAEINKLINEQTKIGDSPRLRELAAQYIEVKNQVEAARKEIELALSTPIEFTPPSAATLSELREIQTANQQQSLSDQLEALRQALSIEIEQFEAQAAREKQILAIKFQDELKATADNAEAQKTIQEQYQSDRERIDTQTTEKVIANRIRLLDIDRQLAEERGDVLKVEELTKQIEELNLQLTELGIKSANIKIDTKEADKSLSKTKDLVKDIIGGIEQLGNQVADFFKQRAAETTQQYDQAIQRQQTALNELLSNQDNASVQAVEIERQRLDNLQKERQRSAENEARITQIQIAANAALAIARAAAEGGGLASAITIASTVAALIFGFAAARTQAEQAFFEGTTYVERNGAPKGRDTIKARLNEGEAVIPTSTNKKYHPAIEAIYNERIPASFLNSIVESYPFSFAKAENIGAEANAKGLVLSGSIATSKAKRSRGEAYLAAIAQNTANQAGQQINITEAGLTKTVRGRIEKEQKTRSKMR